MSAKSISAAVVTLSMISVLCFPGCNRSDKGVPTAADDLSMYKSLQKHSPPTKSPVAPDIIVNTTSDVVDFGGAQELGDLPGPDSLVSLREAFIAAVRTDGPQVIGFNIPTSDEGFDGGVFTIRPLATFNFESDGMIVDGRTQTGFSGNTNANGPEIMVEGSLLPAEGRCFDIRGTGNLMRDLIVSGAPNVGIYLGGEDNTIEGCFVGTDPSGSTAVPNGAFGILVTGEDHKIRGNLVSGNLDNGIVLAAERCTIAYNRVGTDASGINPLPNGPASGPGGGTGVSVAEQSSDNLVVGNIIAFNYLTGVAVTQTAVNNTISRNSIFSNNMLGIDLGVRYHGDGVTPNDPGDGDAGPNNFMNYPVLLSARTTRGRLIVKGRIDTPRPWTVRIEFFANPVPLPGGDPSGHGEGKIFLGQVKPNRPGRFTAALPAVKPGTLVTATATDVHGNTSEFSENIEAKRSRH